MVQLRERLRRDCARGIIWADMSATARKVGSKPTPKGSPKRTSKRGTRAVPAEVVNFVDRRFKKTLAELNGKLEAMERDVELRLQDLARSNPLIAAAMNMSPPTPVTTEQMERYDALLNDRATSQQMEARQEAYQRALEHNPPASDEALAAIVAEWD